MAFSIVSCTKDPIDNSQPQQTGVPVKVQISFRVPKFSYPQSVTSKAASNPSFRVELLSAADGSSDKEMPTKADEKSNPLYNLWVLQFQPDGTVNKIVRLSTTDTPVYENQTLEVELMTGENQTIYLLSLGKQYGDINLNGISSLSALESTSFNFIRYENGLPVPVIQNAEDVPYRGSCSKLTIIQLEENGMGYVDYRNSPDFTGSISMKALVSQVSIDLSYQVTGMTPFSISLNNVPTTFVVNDANFKPSQFVNLPTVILNPADLSGGKRKTFNWYLAPNPQGSVSTITTENQRYAYYNKTDPTKIDGNAPINGTYIHFWASKDGTPDYYALYYLFLGSNTTNDFNVNAHSHYRYRTDMNTADDINDKRIIFKTLKQTVDFAASAFSGTAPAGSRAGIAYDLDVHPDMRPIELTALRGTVTVEILAGSGDASPIAPENSWLKLSTYPNYTAAMDGKRNGSTTALATTVTLDASIPGLFRLYLYSDEYEKYVTDNPNNYKRSLYVKFTFKTKTDQSETYMARMDQVAGFYAGQFGGDMVKSDKGTYYQKGLIVESRQENLNSLYQYLSYYPQSFPMEAAYAGSFMTDDLQNQYHAYDLDNGRLATIEMAENRYKLPVIATGSAALNKIEKPRYTGGYVDLYQYKYYNGDGFAQRWCYDKNRDSNGNGYLDDDEIVWYMPASNQMISWGLNYYTSLTDYLRNTSSTKGMGSSVLQPISMHSIIERVSLSLPTLTVSGISSQGLLFRCVRDAPPSPTGPGGVRYYEEDGYAVIDATGLMAGVAENRVNNPSVVIRPPEDGSDPTYTGRVIRHYMENGSSTSTPINEIDQKVSIRFRVAPRDINVSGNLVTQKTGITWAEASGYDPAANTLPVTADKTGIAETGCAAYKGITGVEDPSLGKWRLPTAREIMLISMLDQTMAATNGTTGYQSLYINNSNFYYNYWTASEVSETNKNYAHTLNTSYKPPRYTNVGGTPYTRSIGKLTKSTKDYDQIAARCIQDLP